MGLHQNFQIRLQNYESFIIFLPYRLNALLSQDFYKYPCGNKISLNLQMQSSKKRLLLHHIKQLVQISSTKLPYIRMKDCTNIEIRKDTSIVVNSQGIIEKIGSSEEIEKLYPQQGMFEKIIDCSEYCVIPGFVDAHTHALFMGDRSREYEMKLNGKGYVDIYNEGLGIRFTTQSVAKSTVQELVCHLDKYLPKMSKLGTTTVEIKSGYGLDAQNQVKMLKAIQIAKHKHKDILTIVSTFCGAHAIPKGKTEKQQTIDVIERQLPAVQSAIENKEISPVFIDVFCEKNFFQQQSSISIMQAGKKIGLIPSFHGDQLNNLESGSIAGKVGARAVSHLEYVMSLFKVQLSEGSVKEMAQKQIVGVLLPTTQNIEKLPLPPVKLMREHNMIVALGSDFCPNAFCYNMALTSHFACTNYRLTPKEALVAATLNSAYALKLQNQVGSIEQGKKADLLLLEADEWVYFVYSFGESPISKVIKNGRVL